MPCSPLAWNGLSAFALRWASFARASSALLVTSDRSGEFVLLGQRSRRLQLYLQALRPGYFGELGSG